MGGLLSLIKDNQDRELSNTQSEKQKRNGKLLEEFFKLNSEELKDLAKISFIEQESYLFRTPIEYEFGNNKDFNLRYFALKRIVESESARKSFIEQLVNVKNNIPFAAISIHEFLKTVQPENSFQDPKELVDLIPKDKVDDIIKYTNDVYLKIKKNISEKTSSSLYEYWKNTDGTEKIQNLISGKISELRDYLDEERLSETTATTKTNKEAIQRRDNLLKKWDLEDKKEQIENKRIHLEIFDNKAIDYQKDTELYVDKGKIPIGTCFADCFDDNKSCSYAYIKTRNSDENGQCISINKEKASGYDIQDNSIPFEIEDNDKDILIVHNRE